jgi:hypothetical protein
MRMSAIVVSLVAVSFSGCHKSSALPSAPTISGPTIGAQMIEGAIEGILAPDTIVVGGKRIVLGSGAVILSGSMPLAFADLKMGARSRVTAQPDSNGLLQGSLVEMLDDVGTVAQLRG